MEEQLCGQQLMVDPSSDCVGEPNVTNLSKSKILAIENQKELCGQ